MNCREIVASDNSLSHKSLIINKQYQPDGCLKETAAVGAIRNHAQQSDRLALKVNEVLGEFRVQILDIRTELSAEGNAAQIKQRHMNLICPMWKRNPARTRSPRCESPNRTAAVPRIRSFGPHSVRPLPKTEIFSTFERQKNAFHVHSPRRTTASPYTR